MSNYWRLPFTLLIGIVLFFCSIPNVWFGVAMYLFIGFVIWIANLDSSPLMILLWLPALWFEKVRELVL